MKAFPWLSQKKQALSKFTHREPAKTSASTARSSLACWTCPYTLKTNEKQEFAVEFTGFDRDVCVWCFRFLDRRAQAKDMNDAKNVKQPKQPKEEKVKKSIVISIGK